MNSCMGIGRANHPADCVSKKTQGPALARSLAVFGVGQISRPYAGFGASITILAYFMRGRKRALDHVFDDLRGQIGAEIAVGQHDAGDKPLAVRAVRFICGKGG